MKKAISIIIDAIRRLDKMYSRFDRALMKLLTTEIF